MEKAEDDPVVQCANPDCKVAAGGKCVEGFSVAMDCPQFGKSLVILETTDHAAAKQVAPGLRLPHADALSVAEAENTIRQKECNVIALVGSQNAGKTSLIAGIYDLLQQGPIGQFTFAGSSTLHAFEHACHDSRRESQRDAPHSERTQLGKIGFFHLDLFNSSCMVKRGALLANRAGEDYMNAQMDLELAKGYPELHRADTVTVLADGAKLLTTERHQTRRDVRLTLRAFLEAGVTHPSQRLAVVLTKIDAIRSDQERGPAALQFFDELVRGVRAAFSATFVDIQAFQVAASPQSSGAPRGEGMVDLLQFWMEEPRRYHHASGMRVAVKPMRAYGRLQTLNR